MADGAPQQAAEADSRIGAGRGNKTVANGNHFKKGQNNAGYLTRRIARNHPEIAERMKAGEFTSVRQAALEAGVVDLIDQATKKKAGDGKNQHTERLFDNVQEAEAPTGNSRAAALRRLRKPTHGRFHL